MATLKELLRKQYELTNDLIFAVMCELDKYENQIAVFYNLPHRPEAFEYNHEKEKYESCEVVAIGKFDGDLCVITKPLDDTTDWEGYNFAESDLWKSFLGNYVGNDSISDIAYTLEYYKKDGDE